MKFSIPVICEERVTVRHHVEAEADTPEEAAALVERVEKDGVLPSSEVETTLSSLVGEIKALLEKEEKLGEQYARNSYNEAHSDGMVCAYRQVIKMIGEAA